MIQHKMKLPQFTESSDKWIFIVFMPVFFMTINALFFGTVYFTDITLFFLASLITGILFSLSWIFLTWIAVTLRNRFPKDNEIIKRLGISILLFVIITALTTTLVYSIYVGGILSYIPDSVGFRWALFTGAIVNIFVTLLHEGVAGFEKWKATLTETDALKKEYLQSRLLGLKSQVNPHFLFNSLNSLSSLICEDPQQAEIFLDEMSKVYRYLLKNSDEQLITLGTELGFVQSYFYLLKSRHREGVCLSVEVPEEHMQKLIPPFTMQILLETTFNTNVISKDQPLQVDISVTDRGWLQIKNNAQRKINEDPAERLGLQNMSKKFRLLCNKHIIIKENEELRVIQVPLINEEENVAI